MPPLPYCPCAPAWAAPLLPFPQACRLHRAQESCSLPSVYKGKLALSSGRAKGGFLLLRNRGRLTNLSNSVVWKAFWALGNHS